MSEAWYRTYRPQTWSDVAGQDHICLVLSRAVAQDRVAHAYLFCGPKGTGKTSLARILARSVNCMNPKDGSPCLNCENCLGESAGKADVIELDAASHGGVRDIRELQDRVDYTPMNSERKVYIIDEVHEMSKEAFDALLKTLEEPPAHILFVLCTTNRDKVPDTIISRCQEHRFRKIDGQSVAKRLQYIAKTEQFTLEDGVAELVTNEAGGSLRDAVGKLEELCITYGGSNGYITVEDASRAFGAACNKYAAAYVRHLLRKRLNMVFKVLEVTVQDGIDLEQLRKRILEYLRLVLLVKTETVRGIGEAAEWKTFCEVEKVTTQEILRALESVSGSDLLGNTSSIPTLSLELAAAAAILKLEDVA